MRTFKSLAGKYSKEPLLLRDLLYLMTKISPEVLSDAAYKGAIWLQKQGKGKILRQRDLNIQVDPKDLITFYHEAHVLKLPELIHAECLYQNKHYSIWIKEAGVVSQGTQAGDHSSLLRFIEKTTKSEAFLIHRLDRETLGPMVFGHTKEGAAKLSELFTKNKITKTYEAIVLGSPLSPQTICEPLDGKEAVTHLEVIKLLNGVAHLKIRIDTGRLHQIRRHLEFIGAPILGDPKYGKGNKNRDGLKLVATELSFIDPWSKESMTWALPSKLAL